MPTQKFKPHTVSAEQKLRAAVDALVERGAKELWILECLTFRISGWATPNGVYVLQEFPTGGWEIYSPLHVGNDINSTLAKVK